MEDFIHAADCERENLNESSTDTDKYFNCLSEKKIGMRVNTSKIQLLCVSAETAIRPRTSLALPQGEATLKKRHLRKLGFKQPKLVSIYKAMIHLVAEYYSSDFPTLICYEKTPQWQN